MGAPCKYSFLRLLSRREKRPFPYRIRKIPLVQTQASVRPFSLVRSSSCPDFLAPGTGFVEDSFSTDGGRGWFQDDLSPLHLLCTVFLLWISVSPTPWAWSNGRSWGCQPRYSISAFSCNSWNIVRLAFFHGGQALTLTHIPKTNRAEDMSRDTASL